MTELRKYVFWKPDLDTVLTAWLTGYEPGATLERVDGQASVEALSCPETVCIECGGSGETWRNNFDHHGSGPWFPPACRQAFEKLQSEDPILRRLVEYVCAVDLGLSQARPGRCTLSMVHSGLRLRYCDQTEQFRRGVNLLEHVYAHAFDPWDFPLTTEWRSLVWEKSRATKRLELYRSQIQTKTTSTGKTLLYLNAPLPGVHGLLKRSGADISVASGLAQGHVTISSECDLAPALRALQERERGWDGPTGGTIIASPPGGSRLSAEEILRILCAAL